MVLYKNHWLSEYLMYWWLARVASIACYYYTYSLGWQVLKKVL